MPAALGYQVAGLRALLAWQPTAFTVDTESAAAGGEFIGFCVVVANSGYFAGGMQAAPGADVSDGLLDVITVREGSKLSFIRVMLLASRVCLPRLASTITWMKESFEPSRTVITSSSPSLISASGAACMPPAK